jgi:hypothetical protein
VPVWLIADCCVEEAMRRRMIIGLAALLYVAAALIQPPRQATALEAWIEKGKSDCASIEVAVTLLYTRDDTGAEGNRDFFKIVLYDGTLGHFLYEIPESITDEQSPFYWQTGRIPTAAYDGLYRVEMWDTDDHGNRQRMIDQAYVQCQTQNNWRASPPGITPAAVPDDHYEVTCHSRTPLYTTNGAPEPGVVIMVWTLGTERGTTEYHLQTIPVNTGDMFDGLEFSVPCDVYLRVYYQPDSTKLLYYMPSQYWPHDLYGTADHEFEVGPIYHTFFPLNGPVRGATSTPTPSIPTVTPTP